MQEDTSGEGVEDFIWEPTREPLPSDLLSILTKVQQGEKIDLKHLLDKGPCVQQSEAASGGE